MLAPVAEAESHTSKQEALMAHGTQLLTEGFSPEAIEAILSLHCTVLNMTQYIDCCEVASNTEPTLDNFFDAFNGFYEHAFLPILQCLDSDGLTTALKTESASDVFFGHIEKIEIACDEQIKRLGVIANTTLNKYQSEVNSKRKTSETFEKDYYVEQLIFQLNWMISRLQVLPAAVPKPTNRKTLPMREPTLWLSQNMTEHDFDSLRSALYRFVTVDLPKLLTKSAKETPEGPEWYFVSQSQMMQEFSSVRRKQLRMANDLYNSTINTYVYQLKALQHKLVICDTPALSTSIPNFSKVYMAMHGDMERIEHILEKLSKNGIQKELLELIQAQNNSLNPLWTTGLTKAASKHANPAALPTSFFQTITQQHIIQVGIPKKPVLLSVSKQTKRPRAIHVNRSAIGTEITLPNVCETLRAGKLGTSSAFRPTVK